MTAQLSTSPATYFAIGRYEGFITLSKNAATVRLMLQSNGDTEIVVGTYCPCGTKTKKILTDGVMRSLENSTWLADLHAYAIKKTGRDLKPTL